MYARLLPVALLLLASPVDASPVFIGLEDLSGRFNAVSGDGRVGVGNAFHVDDASNGGFRWTPDAGFDWIGPSATPLATSYDGSIVVGSNETDTFVEAFAWTSEGGLVGLGDLPGGAVESSAMGVSADGSVIVGIGGASSGAEAFRWTEASGLEGLGDLPSGAFNSSATAVSADGATIVGWGTVELCNVHGCTPDVTEAFHWTAADGMTGLADVTIFGMNSYASAVSADGSVVVGNLGTSAFRWTEEGGLERILEDWEADGQIMTIARAVSADGATVVGSIYDPYLSNFLGAFVWDPLNGPRDLADVLASDYGLDLAGWTLLEATGISADGRTIVGWGTGPADYQQPWMVVVPEPGAGLLVGAALAGLALVPRLRPAA